MRFAPFFFFFEFRPDSADTGQYGRYGPSRPDLGRVSADFSCVGVDFSHVSPIRESPRGMTQHDKARTRGLRRPSRVAASNAGVLAWEPRPCIPGFPSYNDFFFLDNSDVI